MNPELLDRVRQVASDLASQLASIRAQEATDSAALDGLVHAALQQALDQLVQTGCWGPENRIASNELWRIAGPQLETGSMQEHARAKRRGYAGDFEMLEKIATHYLCDDPLGRSMDRFFQQQAAPEAVRSRMRIVADSMTAKIDQRGPKGTHLVSVGSGPALDVAQAVVQVSPKLRQSVRVTLIDIDPEALANAAERLHRLLPANHLICARANLFRLNKRSSPLASTGKADLLSCTGLFDYLDDDHAVAMLSTFWQHLAPGGTMLVFNFAPTNPSRAFMEWIGQWHLLYRDSATLARLAEQAGIDRGAFSMEAGPLGICPYIRATAPASRAVPA